MAIVTFLNNKYLRWYERLMNRARCRAPTGYGEGHHVTPRSLGGDGGEVVRLTFREHFLAHWLLMKFTVGEDRRKMQYALTRMCGMTTAREKARVFIGSWRYAIGRRMYLDARRGRAVTQATRDKMRAAMLGRTITPEWREKLRASRLGKPMSSETKAKLRAANAGKPQTEEAKRKNSLAHRGKKKSAETRRRMSAGKLGHPTSDATKEKIRIGNLGKTLSAATRAKMSASRMGLRHSAETKAKMSAAQRRRLDSQRHVGP